MDASLKALFERPVLEAFAQGLERTTDAVSTIPLADRQQPLALSFAQERQWFLWQLEPESAAYHIPSALRLRGRLDVDALQRSFDSLVARHETLRTRFRLEGGRSYQQVQPAVSVSIEREQFGEEGLIERIQAIVVQPFDLERGPLLRVNLLQLAEDDHVLVLVQHHIVSDGWSMQVMDCENHYIHSFELENGRIKRNREFMNPMQKLRALGIAVPQIKRDGIPT